MSASLVGSEMCIRDSPRLGPRGAGRAARGHGARVLRARVPGVSDTEALRCLLYTSDAADDM
eukprot:10597469-Alexandrium_andersonii.AAC.1